MAHSKDRLAVQELLRPAGIELDGPNPYDPHVRDEKVFGRIFSQGSLAIGESYMDSLWEVEDLSELIARVIRSGTSANFFRLALLKLLPLYLKNQFLNLQSKSRAFEVGEMHYDLGNDLYEKMLDPTMTYTCGYWKDANTLEEAQIAKLDLVCRKLGIKKGDRVLDIGCGWGSFAIHAAKNYGASVVGLTISKEQAELARERAGNLPIEIRLQDYRDTTDGPFDHIVSLGMFEHVGKKNFRTYMEVVKRLLKEDGLFLLHTIGNMRTVRLADPWTVKYIFANGYIPSAAQISQAYNGEFVMEDWHNFGAYYDKTLMAWYKNFETAWPTLEAKYGKMIGGKFFRMWKFYLLMCAGAFRARELQLWQIVLSPKGVKGGYVSVR